MLPLYGRNKVLNTGRKQTLLKHTTAEAQSGGRMVSAVLEM